jgi:hypothetical protein
MSPQLILFPSTSKWYLLKSERITRDNCYRIRSKFESMVDKRREELKVGINADRSDLLTILL